MTKNEVWAVEQARAYFNQQGTPKASKYRNKPVSIDGIRFDSKAEAKRYGQLILLQQIGEIAFLTVHRRFLIHFDNGKQATYEADFTYLNRDGVFFVEDVKGVETPLFKLKRQLFENLYKTKITLIKI